MCGDWLAGTVLVEGTAGFGAFRLRQRQGWPGSGEDEVLAELEERLAGWLVAPLTPRCRLLAGGSSGLSHFVALLCCVCSAGRGCWDRDRPWRPGSARGEGLQGGCGMGTPRLGGGTAAAHPVAPGRSCGAGRCRCRCAPALRMQRGSPGAWAYRGALGEADQPQEAAPGICVRAALTTIRPSSCSEVTRTRVG